MPRLCRILIARTACTVLAAIVLAGACRGAEGGGFDGIPAERLQLVLDHCYNLEGDAEQQINALATDFPKSLVPEFLSVARLYWMQAYVQIDPGLTSRFETAAQALLEKTQRAMHQRPDDPDTAVLGSLCHLTLGGYYAEHQRWWSAFWRVRAGRTIALRVHKDHPDNPEALMPLGVLECYIARTPPVLKPLTLMLGGSGDLESGLENLRHARDRAVLTATDAALYLCILEIDLAGDANAARVAIEPLAQRHPRNPFFQRVLAVCELRTGLRPEGRARLAAVPSMPRADEFPALAVESLMTLCWDCVGTGDYAAALEASERAATIATTDERMLGQRINSLFGQGEALKGLGRYAESFEKFNDVPVTDEHARERAINRVRDIKKEIGWSEPAR